MQELLKELYSDSGPAVQGWRKDLIKLAQYAIHAGTYVLKDSITGHEVAPYERAMRPDKRLMMRFKNNKYLNMNNEELMQLEEAERRKRSGLKGILSSW
jgi:hypothetical protein